MWSHGNFYWNELMTHDPERAKRFYADRLDNAGELILTRASSRAAASG
jgi:predicted enzyme related to lactoylglutathione lyase